jgi:hypothetical protein
VNLKCAARSPHSPHTSFLPPCESTPQKQRFPATYYYPAYLPILQCLTPRFGPTTLDTACYNQRRTKQRSAVVSHLTGTGPGACRTLWLQRGENGQMHRQTWSHPSGWIRPKAYPTKPNAYPGSNLSPLEGKSYNQMPGGGGPLPRIWLPHQPLNLYALLSGLIRHTIYPTAPILHEVRS